MIPGAPAMPITLVEPPASPSAFGQTAHDALGTRAAHILATEIDFLVGIPYEMLAEESLGLESYTAASRLSAVDEARLFRQMNLARYQAARLRQQIGREPPEGALIDEIDRLLERADQIRNLLVIVFGKLTWSIARQFANSQCPLDELISEGHATLLAAVGKFDPERGFRFSTYATHALRRRFLRYLRRGQKERQTFVEWPQDNLLPDSRRWTFAYQRWLTSTLDQIERLLVRLSPRERYILRSRYGWGREFDPRTLQEIADELGISRERVRQLEARSLKRLREAAGEIEV